MALFSAAAKGDVLKIQSLIDSEDKSDDSGGVGVNCSNTSGKTALHIASENGHLQTVKCLINHGAKVNAIDANIQTSVHLCSKKGHLHVVELLVNEGAGTDVGDKDGFTALHIASSEGHLDIVKYLVMKGAQLDKCDKNDRTPLYCASQEGHLNVVKYTVNKAAGIDISDKDGFTALHIASLEGHFDIVKYLVSKGAELERLANDYWTPLHLALDGGHLDIAECLLTGGANINTCGKGGYTALHAASQTGNIDRVKYITSQGAELDRSADDGWTALSLASCRGHLDIVKLLVNGGVEVDKALRNGMTPLCLATERGHLGIVEVLLNEGANIDNCNRDGSTALHIGSFKGHLDIVKYLVRKGAQLDNCDKHDRTPLSCASEEGHLEVAEYIVNKGAGIEIGDKDGVTALHKASLKGHLDIVKYLVRKGADLGRLANDYCTSSRLYKATITEYIDPFSEWWVSPLITRYFIGKRLICTPYVPVSMSSDVLNYILLVIKDEFWRVDEDTIRDYKVAFPGEHFCVYWGQGPLYVRHLENEDEVSTKVLEECAFLDMNMHMMPFILQPREHIVSGVLVTLILKQKNTKSICFPVRFNDEGSPTKASTRPRPLTPPSVESPACEHAYQVTDDLVTETETVASTSSIVPVHSLESAAERKMGAPPAIAANIVQEFVPVLSADRNMHQRSGNVYINAQSMFNDTPVAIASMVPPRLQHELRCRLNRESPVFDDWRGLANQLGLGDYIQSLEQCKNPTEELLVLAESQKKIQNLGDLAKAFERMNRGDCQELCENYAFGKTKSADPRKDQMEDDDTDISD